MLSKKVGFQGVAHSTICVLLVVHDPQDDGHTVDQPLQDVHHVEPESRHHFGQLGMAW